MHWQCELLNSGSASSEDLVEEPDHHDLAVRPAVDGSSDWLNNLPLGWLTKWTEHYEVHGISPQVAMRLITWLQSESSEAECGRQASWLELAAMLDSVDFDHPLQCM